MSAWRGLVRGVDRSLGSPVAKLVHRRRNPGLPWRRDARLRTTWLGSGYGGFPVCTDLLNGESLVYSIGVGEDASFDLALFDRFALELHAFDPTPRSIAWVADQVWPAGFTFHPIGVAARDGTAEFFAPEDPSWVSHSILPRDGARAIEVPVRRLASIARELGHDRISLVKLDVEGSEYEILPDLLAAGPAIDQLLVEFHHRFPGAGLERTREAIRQLRAAGFRFVACSESLEEWAFVHRDAIDG